MKKRPLFLLALCLALLLCACAKTEPAMYIEPAQLTQEEQNIADLLGVNLDAHIFDFQVDDTVQRMSINVYELIDGQWQLFCGGGGQSFTDAKGRILLDFDNIRESFREAVQSEHSSGSTAWESESTEDLAGASRATSLLTQRTEIVYEQEVPLAIQIVTTKNEIRSFDPSYYFHPEDYARYGYEHVYAVTVLFSQQALQ